MIKTLLTSSIDKPPVRGGAADVLSPGERRLLHFLVYLWKPFVRLENLENVERIKNLDDPIIFAFNHNCSYEVFLVPAFLMYLRQGKKISFVIDWMYGRLPGLNRLFQSIDPIYVYNKPARFKWLVRGKTSKKEKVYLQCIQHLNLNKSIGIFPEGKRNRDPRELKRGKNGIGRIVLESRAPVVPIGIDFPLRIKKNKIPRFGSLILRVGEEMDFSRERIMFSQLNRDAVDKRDAKKAVNQLSSKITHMIMTGLSELSGKNYSFPNPDMAGIKDY